jgi:hypothetical protein
MSSMPPSPFLSNSAGFTPVTAECEAVASSQPPSPGATAEPNSAGVVMLPTDSRADSEDRLQNVARPDVTGGESATNQAAAIDPVTGPLVADPQDLIDEIFIGAARLLPRELPTDFQERLLAAIESDDVWVDEPPLFLSGPRK